MLINSPCSPAIWGGHCPSRTESHLPYQSQNRYHSNTTHLPLFDIKAQSHQQNTPPYPSYMPSSQTRSNNLRYFQGASTTSSQALHMPQHLPQQTLNMDCSWPMLSPYGPDYDGTNTSFFQVRHNIFEETTSTPIDRTQLIFDVQYELTRSEDGNPCSSGNDVPASDAVPSMTNSPLQSTASSDACPSPNKTRESSMCGDFEDLGSPFESGVAIKGDSTNLSLNIHQPMQKQPPVAYVNSPWDAPHSQKMMVVDSQISIGQSTPQNFEYLRANKLGMFDDTSIELPSCPIQSTPTGPMSQYECPRMDMMCNATIKCEPLASSQPEFWSQQHGLLIPGPSSASSDATLLSMGMHPNMTSTMAQQHSLPVSPVQFANPTSEPYMYYPKVEQNISGLSTYPVPPGTDSTTGYPGSPTYRMAPKQMSDRGHCDKILQHHLQQAAALKRPRNNAEPYNNQQLISKARRFLEDAYSPSPVSSPADSDIDDNCEGVIVGGAERSARDEYLLKWRNRGWTYKEIRDKGQFAEAESTLRGRFRTLTKEKEARVRKPEWQEKDIKLLKQAVKKFSKSSSNGDVKKISWKQVAEYIYQNGGSYSFGYATCRKRWDEIVAHKED